MRLLNIHDCTLRTFHGDNIPPYAILSHTWLKDEEEVAFAQLIFDPDWRNIPGARKIEYMCEQAAEDGYTWAWIDTCCIDKANSSELSEAINSMFRWYQNSEVCYVYLTDVDIYSKGQGFLSSRWWTRAWTLQELLAPTAVRFLDKEWQHIGMKADLASLIADRTGVDLQSLQDVRTIHFKSVAQRLSWAAHRHATREEDVAYSMLGLLDVNMTMQYGEGSKAFVRLQKEIMRSTDDMSLLTWGLDPRTLQEIHTETDPHTDIGDVDFHDLTTVVGTGFVEVSKFGLFAPHPAYFSQCGDVKFIDLYSDNISVDERHGKFVLKCPMILCVDEKDDQHGQTYGIAILPCSTTRASHCLMGILLRSQPHFPMRFTDSQIMRDAFRGGFYTCLISSEHLTQRYVSTQSATIITGAMQSYHEYHDRNIAKRALSRTLILKFDQRLNGLAGHKLQITPPEWKRDPRDPWLFRTIDNVYVRTRTVISLTLEGSTDSIYIAARWNPYGLGGVAMLIGPALLRLEDAQPTLECILASASLRDNAYDACNHDYLYVSLDTQSAYNQAVTTITFGCGAMQDDNGIFKRTIRQNKYCQTLCVDWVLSSEEKDGITSPRYTYRQAQHHQPDSTLKWTSPYGPPYAG